MIEEVEWKEGRKWAYIITEHGKFLTWNREYLIINMDLMKYQPKISDLLRSNEYDIFLDVGAYHGWFSFIASKHCKYVKAYEANPFHFGILLENMKDKYNVDCEHVFVGCRDMLNKPKHSGIFNKMIRTKGTEYKINKIELNEELMLSKTKTLIKVDVEGNEKEVLAGASKLLKKPNIHWVIDIHTQKGVLFDDITSFFDENRKIKKSHNFLEVYGNEEM